MPDYSGANVVFIMSDQQRADTLGSQRHPAAKAPSLDQLAEESIAFDNFFTVGLPCVPSRASFLTGLYAWQHGTVSNSKFLPPGISTWQTVLREAGYACVSVGKTHHIYAGSHWIQVAVGASWDPETPPFSHTQVEPTPVAEEEYFDFQVTARALEALAQLAKAKQPFSLFVGLHAPHEPYILPARFIAEFAPEKMPLPPSIPDELSTKTSHQRQRQEKQFADLDEESIRRGIAGYFAHVLMVDECVGRLVVALEESGCADNTLLIFTSDHGELLGEHTLFNKAASFYDAEMRVPLLLRLPDRGQAGKRTGAFAASIDLAPTLFDLLGLTPDLPLPARSLAPAIFENKPIRDGILASSGVGLMWRDRTHKLCLYPATGEGELYDLDSDPHELRNLFDTPENMELQERLMRKLIFEQYLADADRNRVSEREKILAREFRAGLPPEP